MWVFYFCFAIELRSSLFIVDVNPLSGPWYPLLSLGCFLSVDCFLCFAAGFFFQFDVVLVGYFCFVAYINTFSLISNKSLPRSVS